MWVVFLRPPGADTHTFLDKKKGNQKDDKKHWGSVTPCSACLRNEPCGRDKRKKKKDKKAWHTTERKNIIIMKKKKKKTTTRFRVISAHRWYKRDQKKKKKLKKETKWINKKRKRQNSFLRCVLLKKEKKKGKVRIAKTRCSEYCQRKKKIPKKEVKNCLERK